MHWAVVELAIGGGDVSARSCDGPNVLVGVKAASRRFAVPLRGSLDSDCARWAGGVALAKRAKGKRAHVGNSCGDARAARDCPAGARGDCATRSGSRIASETG